MNYVTYLPSILIGADHRNPKYSIQMIQTTAAIIFILLEMKAELTIVGCFLILISTSQAQLWASNITPMRQTNLPQFQKSNRSTTQIQQRPFLQKEASQLQIKGPKTRQPQLPKAQSNVQTKPTLKSLQTNQAKRSNSQLKLSQPQTNQAQFKRTQNLGTSQKQNSLNLMKPNRNRLQQRQSPTKQTANLSQQSRRTQNKTQTNFNRPQAHKPTSHFQTNQSRTSPIQQQRIPPKQSQRQRNVSVFQQKQAQTQRNRYPTKQIANNVSQVQTRNKFQRGLTPTNLSSQRKQKAPQQIQQQPIQNRQISSQIKNQFQIRQTGSQFQMGDQPLLNQTLSENSTYPPQPHPFRMTPNYSHVLKRSPYYGIVRRLFNIGAAYFRRVLKVTPIPQLWTRYTNSNGSLNLNANARFCHFKSRPIYGRIQYVKQRIVMEDPINIRGSISTTIHQMMHILAVNSQLYWKYYINRNNYQPRSIYATIQCNWKNCSIITPKVMQYVRDYFNCDEDQTGAMLVSKKDLAHWNMRVFYDEIMTPIGRDEGNKITGLSLALLQDSGFYSSVDYSYSQNATFGRGKGCSFAKDIRSKQDQCQQNICDNEHRYGQYCAQLSQNRSLTSEFGFLGFICDDPLLSIQDPWTLSYYGRSSRCFNIEKDHSWAPACYKAECRNGIISIKIGEKSHTCNKPGEWLSVGYEWKVQCPKDLQFFCEVPICHDLCEGRGVCVNGKCFYPT